MVNDGLKNARDEKAKLMNTLLINKGLTNGSVREKLQRKSNVGLVNGAGKVIIDQMA